MWDSGYAKVCPDRVTLVQKSPGATLLLVMRKAD